MAKSVLVVTGSPRRGGNSDMLADAFIKGAIGAGHEVAKFAAAFNPVEGCKACEACWSQGDACVFPDGFRKLSPLLEKADVLVLATPLYWFGFSAQLKAAVDKLYAYMSPNRKAELKIAESVLLVTAEGDDEDLFDGAVATYLGISDYLQWNNLGIITVPEVNNKGDIIDNPALDDAEALGANL